MPMFFDCTLTATLRQVAAGFPVVVVTGPRQVGKTTLLEACAEAGRGSVALDDLDARDLAGRDPALFLRRYPPPVLIDEVRYVPPFVRRHQAGVPTLRPCRGRTDRTANPIGSRPPRLVLALGCDKL